jgi:pyruvate, water dikinase
VTAVIVTLAGARDSTVFGGKAAQLGTALRAGLPVPDGVALSADAAEAVCRGEAGALRTLREACPRGPCAVRSSAVGEDSDRASFAGTHLTVLGVRGIEEVTTAVGKVVASGLGVGAVAYRSRLGLDPACAMGVVVQELVEADVAGVMFTRNPVTGAAERVIEASWGLGCAVVDGMVVPDRYRLDDDGRLLERTLGEKDVCLRHGAAGTEEVPVPPDRIDAPCLGETGLDALHRLAVACDRAFGSDVHDTEFAFRADALFLLQRRPITGG